MDASSLPAYGVAPNLAVLGAGRLSSAILRRLHTTGIPSSNWSRRYECHKTSPVEPDAYGITTLEAVSEAEALISGIPNHALIDLSKRHSLAQFAGVIYAIGIDTPVGPIREAYPQALVVRLSPAIPQDGGEVRSIGLFDERADADDRSSLAKTIAGRLGTVTWVDTEPLYDLTTLVAGPILTLLTSTVENTVKCVLERHGMPASYGDFLRPVVLRELSRRAQASAVSTGDVHKERATPGGMTELALSQLQDVTEPLIGVVDGMLSRMSALRDMPII